MNYNLIGLSGKKRSGKDTVASILKEILPENYELKSFAYNLKKICSIITGLPVSTFLDDKHKMDYLEDWDMTIRTMLQLVGTEVFRDNFKKDIWIKSLFSEYAWYNNWIITDVRFHDELNFVKSKGGIIIRVDASYDGYEIPSDQHQSEIELDNSYDKFDFVINNDSDIESLKNKVTEIVSKWDLN